MMTSILVLYYSVSHSTEGTLRNNCLGDFLQVESGNYGPQLHENES